MFLSGSLIVNRGLKPLIRGPHRRSLLKFSQPDIGAQEVIKRSIGECDVLHPRMAGPLGIDGGLGNLEERDAMIDLVVARECDRRKWRAVGRRSCTRLFTVMPSTCRYQSSMASRLGVVIPTCCRGRIRAMISVFMLSSATFRSWPSQAAAFCLVSPLLCALMKRRQSPHFAGAKARNGCLDLRSLVHDEGAIHQDRLADLGA